MRVAINLLTDDPDHPSGAHWFWTRVIPEMAALLADDEEFQLLVSPRTRSMHAGYGDKVGYVTFPWSNESPPKRTLTEHLYAPVRLPLARIDVLSTLMAPIVRAAPGLVVHFKTMHAFTQPQAIRPAARLYRQMNYPRTAKVADAIIINSESLRHEVTHYLDVDPAKLRLIPEAVDHELFRPGDRDEAWQHVSSRYGITRPFVLFVSSLWPYKNCEGLLRAFASAKADLGDRQLAVVGPGRDTAYLAELKALAEQLGIAEDVVWVGGVSLDETVHFYRCRRRVRVPVVQRDVRAAAARGHGRGLPGGDLRHQRDAGDRRRRRAARRPEGPGVDRGRRGEGLRARGGAAAGRRPRTGRGVHLGGDRGADPRRLPRGLRPHARKGGRR